MPLDFPDYSDDPFLAWYHGLTGPADPYALPIPPPPSAAPTIEPAPPMPPEGGPMVAPIPSPEQIGKALGPPSGAIPPIFSLPAFHVPPVPPVPPPAPAAAPVPPESAPPRPTSADAITGGATGEQQASERHRDYLDTLAGENAQIRPEGTPEEEERIATRRDAAALAEMSPAELERLAVENQRARIHDESAARLRANEESERAARENLGGFRAAQAQAKQDTAALYADARKLASEKIDPSLHLGIAGTIATVLLAGIGGGLSKYTGGRNLVMEQLDRAVDRHVEAQRANLANRFQALGMRRGMIGDELARQEDTYRTLETARVAGYQRAIDTIQTRMQDFNPRGQTALAMAQAEQQFRGRQAQALQAIDDYNFERRKKEWDLAKTKAEVAKLGAESGQLRTPAGAGAAGVGGPTNPNYTVPIGIFDPFSASPILGKRKLDKEETGKAHGLVSVYGHVQDYWADLARIGAKIDGHKSLEASIWSKLKSTDAAEYDAARHALVVYLTQQLGDKLTQGQIDEQSGRIPELKSMLELRDPLKQIADAQELADRDFSHDMNTYGIDGRRVIDSARASRKPPPIPEAKDNLEAALTAQAKAAAGTAARRDADAQVGSAQETVKLQGKENEWRQFQRDGASRLAPWEEPVSLPYDEGPNREAGKLVVRLVDTYNGTLKKFRDADEDRSYRKGLAGAGEIEQATEQHKLRLGNLANDVFEARRLLGDQFKRYAGREPDDHRTRAILDEEAQQRASFERAARTHAAGDKIY